MHSNYVDEFYADFSNTASRVAGDYLLTRLSAGYHGDNWQLTLYVNNAFDEYGETAREPTGAAYPQGYVALVTPRTIGGSVTYRF